MGRTIFDTNVDFSIRCNGCKKEVTVEDEHSIPEGWTRVTMLHKRHEDHVMNHLVLCEECTPHFNISMLTLLDSLKPEPEVDLS